MLNDKSSAGFTLIETLSAIVVFFIVTLGVLPLINSSLRGSALARSLTVGKNVAEQAMERARGLPYHNSRTTQRLDLLDFYYPRAAAPFEYANQTYDPVAGTFTTTCTSTTATPACPRGIPPGYTVRFRARFVKQTANVPAGQQETYTQVVFPPSTYAWNVQGASNPPDEAQYVRLAVSSSWTANGRPRSFTLESLLGERKSSALQVDGFARIDHLVQVLTSFEIGDQRSDLTVTAGIAESRIESRALSSADQSVTAARARVTDANRPRVYADAEVQGASDTASAPPDTVGTKPAVSVGRQTLTHPVPAAPAVTPIGGEIAAFGSSTTADLFARQAASVPVANGQFSFATPSSPLDLLLVNNQADTSDTSRLRLANTGRMVWMSAPGGRTMYGRTSATTTPAGATKSVRTTAVVRGGEAAGVAAGTIHMLPVTFAGNGGVVEIDNFTATVDCPSTGQATTTPVATWSAALRYWRETSPTNNVTAGSYVTMNLAGSRNTGAPRPDPLAALLANPPMVYESTELDDPENLAPQGSERDVYLFPVTHTHTVDDDDDEDADPDQIEHDHPGYLSAWSSIPDTITSKDGAGRTTSAEIGGAIKVTTTPTDPQNPATTIDVSVGDLSCQALDRRL